jgi:HNH endonuclease
MEITRRDMTVAQLVDARVHASISPNEEYQRGEKWNAKQQKWFVDSVFRGYAVPAFYLRKREGASLDGDRTVSFEIIDGYQRTLALAAYRRGDFKLLPVADLQLPRSLREIDAPWAERPYHELHADLRKRFDETQLIAYHLVAATPDEVRDLFIRLNSGTALTPQEKRDAFPGGIGPFVNRIAGKIPKHPAVRLFSLTDKRGLERIEDEELRDPYVPDRQLCAQLLLIFLKREQAESAFPRTSARDLDRLYHEFVEFDPDGQDAERAARFRKVLEFATAFFETVRRWLPKVKKIRRLDVAAIVMIIHDAMRQGLKITESAISSAAIDAAHILDDQSRDSRESPRRRSTSKDALVAHYSFWRQLIAPESLGVVLDDQRVASAEQRSMVCERDNWCCAVCGQHVDAGEVEIDHFPIAHRDGGRTELDNLRLVHRQCHKRGRPAA